MTRKDFQLIADVLLAQRAKASTTEKWRLSETARAFADALATTNERFDRARFLKACGVDG